MLLDRGRVRAANLLQLLDVLLAQVLFVKVLMGRAGATAAAILYYSVGCHHGVGVGRWRRAAVQRGVGRRWRGGGRRRGTGNGRRRRLELLVVGGVLDDGVTVDGGGDRFVARPVAQLERCVVVVLRMVLQVVQVRVVDRCGATAGMDGLRAVHAYALWGLSVSIV